MTTATIVEQSRLDRSPTAGLFEGADFGNPGVSFFMVHSRPGQGPELHVHPYAEVFVVHAGESTFTVGDETVVAPAGQIVVAPAGVPHRFLNTGEGELRMTCIHPRDRVEQTWLG